MIGIDLLEIERMRRPMSNARFRERLFTEREREYLRSRGLQSAAGLFCAKEAVSKALGIGLLALNPHSIEIVHTPTGQPTVELSPPLPSVTVYVSITHTGTTAAAAAFIKE